MTLTLFPVLPLTVPAVAPELNTDEIELAAEEYALLAELCTLLTSTALVEAPAIALLTSELMLLAMLLLTTPSVGAAE